MVNERALQDLLATFARVLVTDYQVGPALDDMCRKAVSVLPVSGAGVMLADERGDLRFVAASDAVIQEIEVLQTALGEGPCREAVATCRTLACDDLTVGGRWPDFSRYAVKAGIRAVYSMPMSVNGQPFGAFDLHRDTAGSLDGADLETARLIADVATSYVFNARQYQKSVELNEQLQQALTSRLVVEQAKGRIAALTDVRPEVAFERLRSYARRRQRKVQHVARDLVEGRLPVEAIVPPYRWTGTSTSEPYSVQDPS